MGVNWTLTVWVWHRFNVLYTLLGLVSLYDMKYTKEEIIKRITTQLDECLESANAEIYNYNDKIVDVDIENQTITIKFDYHVVEEDDYVGLGFY